MNTSKEISKVEKELFNWLYQNKREHILQHDKLDLYQSTEESDEAFSMRVQQQAREERDEEMDELQEKYEAKFDKLQDKIRKEERDLEEAKSEVRDRRNQELINVAETIFTVFGGRRRRSLSGAATKRRMARKAKDKVEESYEELEELEYDYKELKQELQEKVDTITKKWSTIASNIEKKEIKPRKMDVKVDQVMLVWYPYWVDNSGLKVSALR